MVCGIVVDGFFGWGGGMAAASGWLDAGCAASCGGAFSKLGGGGGGDGVGEWSGVSGLGEVWVSGGLSGQGGESKSENIWLIC